MIELQRHIEILLLTNDCVIVPGLGGFMAHHIEARFDEEDNTFVPPLRTLGFNQNLTMNDSLLVQSYIECYDISYPEALRRIEDEVNELRQHLQTEGSFELNDIGMLTLNSEGNIEFRPCEAGILTPGLYGLGTFEMEPLQKAVTVMVEGQRSKDEGQPDEPMVLQVAEDEQQEVAEEEKEPVIVIKLSWLRNAVAVAAAVLAFFMIATPVSNSQLDIQKGVQQSSIIPLSKQEPLTTWGDEALVPELEKQNPLQWNIGEESDKQNSLQEDLCAELNDKEEITSEQPAADVTEVTPPAVEYCIVLACQVSQKNADGLMALLQENGFNNAYITNKKFRRVCYGHYATNDEATSDLRQLRQQSKKLFGEGWVMKVKSEK